MGFDAQAFATAFLEGQAKDIKERFAKAEKLREEELAKAERNLPLYKKRLQQKKNMLSMANTLDKMGVDKENIMYFAKDGPESLKAIYNIILNKQREYKGVTGNKLSEEQLNNMAKMPQEFKEAASEYKSLADFLDQGYKLSVENDKAEKPETPEIMSGNFFMGLMGYGAKERVKERLETEKFIGDTTIADLNRLAAQQDFLDPTGGTFDPAVIDPSAGPRIIDDVTRRAILSRQDTLYERYTTGSDSQAKINAFLDSKNLKGDVAISADILTAMTDPQNVVNQDNLAYAREFKDKMQYEAFKDASLGYNLGKAEIQQINPAFVTLDDKYGKERETNLGRVGDVYNSPEALREAFLKGEVTKGEKHKVKLPNGDVQLYEVDFD
jgi:hypothetical protein